MAGGGAIKKRSAAWDAAYRAKAQEVADIAAALTKNNETHALTQRQKAKAYNKLVRLINFLIDAGAHDPHIQALYEVQKNDMAFVERRTRGQGVPDTLAEAEKWELWRYESHESEQAPTNLPQNNEGKSSGISFNISTCS